MHRLLSVSLSLACVVFLASSSIAQTTATSDPVGFTTTSCLSNSDTFVSLPFTRAPEFVGAISSASGNTITVSGSPWTASQFVYVAGAQQRNHYYALIGSGPKEGHYYPITGNTTNALTVTTTLLTISLESQRIHKFSLFPTGHRLPFFQRPMRTFPSRPRLRPPATRRKFWCPIRATAGINLPYLPAYFFSNNVDGSTSGWRVVGNNTTDRGDDILLPENYFVIRNANGAPTLPLTSVGSVLTKKFAMGLVTSATQAQDNAVAMIRPGGCDL